MDSETELKRLPYSTQPSNQGRIHMGFVEIGPKMLARIAKHTGLKPEDL
jgi:hypothetical protein